VGAVLIHFCQDVEQERRYVKVQRLVVKEHLRKRTV
jgi:hypothetical protein